MLVGLRGLVGQLYREDNAHKVRRGQAGRVKQGLAGGGLTYGYAAVAGKSGERVVVEAEAHVIRRIFQEYVDGRTPREIAHDLNKERVSPPRGRAWNASTINGNLERGAGILQNELYVGRLVWNKVRMVKDPDSGKRLSRPNPKSDWQVAEVLHLAIVSSELFTAAQKRKEERGRAHPSHQRRPRRMLSGLLRCGSCGSGMATNGRDKSGRVRIRCSAATESGMCPDAKTFYLDTVECAVLSGLKAELRAPKVISEYVRTYLEDRKRLAATSNAKRQRLEQQLGQLNREIERLVDAIAKGHGDPSVLGPRSTSLDAERKRISEELQSEPPAPKEVALHPAVLKRYEEQLGRLEEALAKGVSAGDGEAAEAIRDLVETVTVFRDPGRTGGVAVEIAGRLNALLGEKAYPNHVKGVWGKVVAGEGLATTDTDIRSSWPSEVDRPCAPNAVNIFSTQDTRLGLCDAVPRRSDFSGRREYQGRNGPSSPSWRIGTSAIRSGPANPLYMARPTRSRGVSGLVPFHAFVILWHVPDLGRTITTSPPGTVANIGDENAGRAPANPRRDGAAHAEASRYSTN
ncbi:recombinase family protein [Bradyrhizobium erythrophlei]|uniref:recombinase family protein n=1 Tax=Bradyrhizobium erythrophlei TaxID=1437360 RepID=UPI0035EB64BE